MKRIVFIALFVFSAAQVLLSIPKEIEEALKLNHINHYDEALGVVERALQEGKLKPDITSAYTMGRILYRKGELYREMAELAVLTNIGYFLQVKGSEKNPPDEIGLFLGIGYFFNKQYVEAAGSLNQVLSNNKLGGELLSLARVYLGASYYKTGQKDRASELWKLVDKEHLLAYSSLGYIYSYLGTSLSQGEQMTQDALKRGEARALNNLNTLRVNRAYSLLALGRFDEAYAGLAGVDLDVPMLMYRQSENKEIRFYDLTLLYNYSSILFAEAVKNLEPVVTASSGELASFSAYYVAQMYLYLGSLDKSLKYALKAKKLSVASSLTMVRAAACEAAIDILSGKTAKGMKLLTTEAERIHGKPSMLLEMLKVVISSGVEYAAVKDFVSVIESYVYETEWDESRRDTALLGELSFYSGRYVRALYYLERARDKGNKNKIETNDPNFLLKLSFVYYSKEYFPESLEILFSLGRSFTGVRLLQDAVQSVYSYKQRGTGETFIE